MWYLSNNLKLENIYFVNRLVCLKTDKITWFLSFEVNNHVFLYAGINKIFFLSVLYLIDKHVIFCLTLWARKSIFQK